MKIMVSRKPTSVANIPMEPHHWDKVKQKAEKAGYIKITTDKQRGEYYSTVFRNKKSNLFAICEYDEELARTGGVQLYETSSQIVIP